MFQEVLAKVLTIPFKFTFGYAIALFVITIFTKIFKNIILINRESFATKINDKYLELMIKCVALSFHISEDLRKNIKDFEGSYVFKTRDGIVVTSVEFAPMISEESLKQSQAGSSKQASSEHSGHHMIVKDGEIEKWDIMFIFKNAKVMRDCLKSIITTGNLDILNLMLEDKIETVGNLNYAYRFLFLVNTLTHKIPKLRIG